MTDGGYDVFVSYRNDDPVRVWVRRDFGPLFAGRLVELLGWPKVFFDYKDLQAGDVLKVELRDALLSSRILIPVWSPAYFFSRWCVSELQAFRAQQHGVVVPVLFANRGGLPDEFRDDVLMADFTEYAFTARGWRKTSSYVQFEKRVQDLAATVAKRLTMAKTSRPPFPDLLPSLLAVAPAPEISQQRLG